MLSRPMLTSLVVAIDRSTASSTAARFAAALATRTGARLHAVHVEETGDDAPFAPLASVVAHLGAVVRRGDPARAIVDFADECHADLVITGTRAAPGKSRLLDESVAGAVIRRARVPVLVVPEGAPVPSPGDRLLFRRPLVAVDYGEPSRAALRTAAALAGEAPIEVLHVIPGESVVRELEALNARARALEDARGALETYIRESIGGPPTHARVTVGMPPTAVVDAAIGGAHDLVAVGSRRHALSGCVAEALIDSLRCPVLIHRGAPGEMP